MDFIYITKGLYNKLQDVYGTYFDKIVDDFKSIGGLFAVFGDVTISTKTLNCIPNTYINRHLLTTIKTTSNNKKRHFMCDIVAIMDITSYIRGNKYTLYPSIVRDFFMDSLLIGAKLRQKIGLNTCYDGTLIVIDGKFCYDAHTLAKYY